MAQDDWLREVCFVIGADGEILWRDQGTVYALPDSRGRWEAIWSNRSRLAEIAHSHPSGFLGFSEEDRTTMLALWAALDRDITFSVVTPDFMIRTRRDGEVERVADEPEWVLQLRAASGLHQSAD